MDKILNNIGLCHRARGVIFGQELTLEAIRAKKCYLVFVASDAGENAKKQMNDKCTYYNVPIDNSYTSDELSQACGKDNLKVIGIKDQGFVKILKK